MALIETDTRRARAMKQNLFYGIGLAVVLAFLFWVLQYSRVPEPVAAAYVPHSPRMLTGR
jgi:ABC-type transporter Mla subunit MlaD